MSATQTMTSSSMFSSPFHNAPSDPEALGSYTSCEGPAAKPQTSPVAKIRKHFTSTFSGKDSKGTTDFLKSKPFDSDIVILDFVPEVKSASSRAGSKSPPCGNTPEPPVNTNHFAPFDSNIVSVPFITEDPFKQRRPDRKLRHFSSRATIAGTIPSESTSHLMQDDMSARTVTSASRRPSTAGGISPRPVGAGVPSRDCQCPCGCPECYSATAKNCKCACSCKDCYCRSRNLSQRLIRRWQARHASTSP
jgi:hypothetical protein